MPARTRARAAREAVIGAIALAYAVWLVVAAGLEYLLVGMLVYLAGLPLHLWARREATGRLATRSELGVLAGIVALGLVGLIGMISGRIAVL